MLTLLQHAVTAGVLRELDVQLARLLAAPTEPACLLAIAWLSAENGEGHVCLPLANMTQDNLFNGRQPELAIKIWQQIQCNSLQDWREILLANPNISDGKQVTTPLIVDQDRFYLQRMWQDEGQLAKFFSKPSRLACADDQQLQTILHPLFPNVLPENSEEIDWQKVAAAIAVTSRIAVISGGPGTGKTTTVARLLAVLLKTNQQKPLIISLAAPTGKAAARLTESLSRVSSNLSLTPAEFSAIPSEAMTLHRLLGCRSDRAQPIYHSNNRLPIDVLVVDEASMVDMPMMAKIVAALPEHARLILLGDRDQLSSVESGAVLGDICNFAERGYSSQRASQLSALTGYALSSGSISEETHLGDNICLLRKSHRFGEHSGIGRLAHAVNCGDSQAANMCFELAYTDLARYDLCCADDYQKLVKCAVDGYRQYLVAALSAPPQIVLNLFNQFRLLCALRNGAFGVAGLNDNLEHALSANCLIRRTVYSPWYIGRPVMINQNDDTLNLFNGDIGIALSDQQGNLRVYFQLSDGSLKSIQPNRLPSHETAYAMTVHKSQGSEFNHTLLVLPDSYSPLLSRELVYTAITRARQKLTLYADPVIFSNAIQRPTRRISGLVQRIKLYCEQSEIVSIIE